MMSNVEFSVIEPNFPQLVELLHVPLQSLYRYHQKQAPSENGQNSL